jgi:ubiquinone/menaquinone biosynthesis C-methylase UbiE
VTGIDIEQYKLDYAVSKAKELKLSNTKFVCYEGGEVPFEQNSFDAIFCIDVVEHLPTPEKFLADFHRILKPGGILLLSFGPPWCHAHGKHMWAKLPGWWTHLLFPRPVVMRISGFPAHTTWEQLGMHRLTVAKFDRAISRSGLSTLYYQRKIKKLLTPLKYVPGIRELFISEIVGVFRKAN